MSERDELARLFQCIIGSSLDVRKGSLAEQLANVADAVITNCLRKAISAAAEAAWDEGMERGRARWMRDDDTEEYPPVNPYRSHDE